MMISEYCNSAEMLSVILKIIGFEQLWNFGEYLLSEVPSDVFICHCIDCLW